MRKASRKRILLVARHPVGGILTFFKYVYGQPCFRVYDFTVIVPYSELYEPLKATFENGDFEFIAVDKTRTMMRRIWTYLKDNEVSLVHCHGFTAAMMLMPVIILGKATTIVTSHDIFQHSQFRGLRGWIKKRILSITLGRVDVIHTVGYEATDNLKQFFPGVDKERIQCIPNGIEVDEFYHATQEDIHKEFKDQGIYLIGFFGRFMSQKGFKYLVDAVEIITKENLSMRQLLVLTYGWGGYIREEYEMIENRGLKRYFHAMPQTDNMPSVIKSVDLVVIPSLWEALPLLAMESLVAGIPTVGTNCIGLHEVLSGSPATMVDPRDSVSLAKAIANEINHDRKKEFRNYSSTAKNRFSNIPPAQNLNDLYKKLTKGA